VACATAADGIGHRADVQPTAADHHHVRLLAWRQGPDSAFHAESVCAIDGRPAQRIAHAEAKRGRHLVASVVAVVATATLGLQRESHLAEEVAGVARDCVAGEARPDSGVDGTADDRVAHAHLHLGLRARGDLAVMIG
jgi:hypothetical protein